MSRIYLPALLSTLLLVFLLTGGPPSPAATPDTQPAGTRALQATPDAQPAGTRALLATPDTQPAGTRALQATPDTQPAGTRALQAMPDAPPAGTRALQAMPDAPPAGTRALQDAPDTQPAGTRALQATPDALPAPPPSPAALVNVAIVNPMAGAAVGGEMVHIDIRVGHPKDITIDAVDTEVTELGAPALTFSYAPQYPVPSGDRTGLFDYLANWNTLLMHNGDCRITTRVACRQGDWHFTVDSDPVIVTVTNLWINQATPATAFFTVGAGQSQPITVDFDHYLAAGPYRVTYTFRSPQYSALVLRSIVHNNVTKHFDSCMFTADKATFPYGAYVCFDIEVSCAGDDATLISPTCKVLQKDSEFTDKQVVALVYALSEPPSPGGLSILCFSNLVPIGSQEGLSDQCCDWQHAVLIHTQPATSFRSVCVGMDNHTDNRGRAPQPIMPES